MTRVLLTNDDGVQAKGLEALRTAISNLGVEVFVVAPDRNQSATSHSLTLSKPLKVDEVSQGIYSVQGTPTDCVMLAVRHLLNTKPDIILSGINHGPNLGDDVSYSGTVAAAIEGTMLGVLSIAVSLADWEPLDFSVAAEVAAEIAQVVLRKGLPEDTYLNINVPDLHKEDIAGVEITRMGKRIYRDAVEIKSDEKGNTFLWIGGQQPSWEGEDHTDFRAIEKGKISITPLHLDLTNYRAMETLREWDFTILR
jgi:5'-nucleotidase